MTLAIDVDGDGIPDRIFPPDRGPVEAPALPVTVRREILARRDADRAPVLPAWARSRQDLRAITRWLAGFYSHTAAFHAVRLPLYGAKVAYRAPLGALVVLAAVSRWVADAEARPLRAEAVRTNDPRAYMTLARQQRERGRWRWPVVGAGVSLVLAAAIAVTLLLPVVLQLASAAGVMIGLARLGTPADKSLTAHAVTKFQAPRLDPGMVIAALVACGVGIKDPATVGFPAPITRDGDGWRADIDLPLGITALEVADKREKLASGLRRQTTAVWPEHARGQHAGRLVLWVGDKPMSESVQPAWELAHHGSSDVFKPIPYGFNQRSQPISIPLMYSNLLVGAIPRQGKTFSVRVVVLAVALDPIVEMHVHELKGTNDLESVEGCSHRFTTGAPSVRVFESVMQSIREVHSYLEPRAETIGRLPKDLCPESKVTPLLARRRELGLHPVLLVVDEVQELFESEYGKEAETLLKAIIKRGPALAIMLILATQRPDKDSLPTAISSSMGTRLCLKVMGHTENDMILGTSAHRNGMRATNLTDDDKGVGLLRDGGAATLVRGALIDGPAAAKIGARARAQRDALGLLSGHAVGQVPEITTITISIVDDVRATFRGETALWGSIILSRLQELRPGYYGGWTAAALTVALKKAGIERAGRQVERAHPETGERQNNRGVYLEDLGGPAITPNGD